MKRGMIESLNTKRDAVDRERPTFGFIVDDDGASYFFLPTGMQKTSDITFDDLKVGDKVEFNIITHPKGPRAIEISAWRGGK